MVKKTKKKTIKKECIFTNSRTHRHIAKILENKLIDLELGNNFIIYRDINTVYIEYQKKGFFSTNVTLAIYDIGLKTITLKIPLCNKIVNVFNDFSKKYFKNIDIVKDYHYIKIIDNKKYMSEEDYNMWTEVEKK